MKQLLLREVQDMSVFNLWAALQWNRKEKKEFNKVSVMTVVDV